MFMTKIQTAEEVVREICEVSMDKGVTIFIEPEEIVQCMQEYAKQFIDLAAEQARIRNIYFIDKESILKLKERVV